MLAIEPRNIALVQAVGAKHRILSDDEAGYILWNETAYPLCDQSHMIRQVREFFGELSPDPCVSCPREHRWLNYAKNGGSQPTSSSAAAS